MPRVLTQAHLDAFRSRLCQMAARLYSETGHGGFSMRELAARLGVSAMTPYRYFSGKDEILAALRAQAAARLAERLEAALLEGPAAAVQAYIDFAMRDAAYYRLMFDLFQPQRPGELACQEHRVRSAMALAVAMGRSPSKAAAASLWAALHGGVSLVLAGKLSEAELGELASRLVSIFFGMRKSFAVPPVQTGRELPEAPSPDPVSAKANLAAE